MKIDQMSDKILLNRTHELVILERKTLKEILDHLREIYHRRLYANLGYSNLIKFMIVELKYSESSAYRRYQALKLTEELPAAKSMIEDGSLSLSNAIQVQTLLKGESTNLKQEALNKIKNTSSRTSEKILFDLCPAAKDRVKKRDSVVAQSSTDTRISVTVNNSTMDKLNRLKARTKKYDTAALLDFALDLALKHTDILEKKTRKSRGSVNPRIIPAETRREVLKRAHGKCQYLGCGEIHFLEIDHKIPVSHGGKNGASNLRLLCHAHHKLITKKQLGLSFK